MEIVALIRDISIIIMTLSVTLAVAFITGWLISD